MAEFLTTSGVSNKIEEVIMYAQNSLTLVSPYLKFNKTFYERLKDASVRGVNIQIVYGKEELNASERKKLSDLDSLDLFFFENLHAKCYFNEDNMVITSMNMYEFSLQNNREMGVFYNRENDPEIFERASNETKSIIQSSKSIQLNNAIKKGNSQKFNDYSQSKYNYQKPLTGFCIRCKSDIPLDFERPYCRHCFSIWSQFSNPEYQEQSCHKCGKNSNTSIIKPSCYPCYKKYQTM